MTKETEKISHQDDGYTSSNFVEIGFFELLLSLVRRRKFILGFTLVGALLITAVCFVIPRKWSSNALISPIADNTAGIQLSADIFSSFGNMPLLSSQKMDMAVDFLTVMDSRSFREDIIRRFKLIDYFQINESDSLVAMEKALLKLNDSVMKAALEQQSNTILITVTTREKLLSKEINDHIISSLEYYISHQKKVKSKITREFLEERTGQIKAQIDSLLTLTKEFEAKGKAFAPDEQTKQTMDLYSEIVSQQMLNQIELEVALQQYGEQNPKVTELETKAELLKKKLQDFETNHSGELPSYLLKLKDLPDIGMQYSKLKLDSQILKQVYEYLYPMTEAARLTELKDMPAIEVMDRPSLAGLHAYPKRLLLICFGTLAILLLACLIALSDAYLSDEQRVYLKALKKELGFSAKSGSDA